MNFYELVILHYNKPLNATFTYSINQKIQAGDLLKVTVKNKDYFAICFKEVEKPDFECKEAELICKKALSDNQIQIANFIHSYYCCTISKAYSLFFSKKLLKVRSLKKISDFKEEESIQIQIEQDLYELNKNQEEIYKNIKESKNLYHLIHGITGSGKTEIYMHLIKDALHKNQDVLFLVPQLSLLPQMKKRLEKAFPNTNILEHSHKVSSKEYSENYINCKAKTSSITISSRSGLFLPFNNLGLIIMDEEHDQSYKQDQTPKYHAKSIVQNLAKLSNSKLILGSATPSLETFKASQNKVVEIHKLNKKFKDINKPEITVVDISNHLLKNPNHYLSPNLISAISDSIHEKKQVLLLSNRRGYSNFLMCLDCKEINECDNCATSFTVHKNSQYQYLKCHYCNNSKSIPIKCSKCGSTKLQNFGSGIQNLDELLKEEFPKARILRMDSDSTSAKNSIKEIHEKLDSNDFDIILGTQMVAQGLDLKRLNLVGVIFAEENLNLPDFRTHERYIQLLNQVVGRTGRHTKNSKVIIQTLKPENKLFHQFLDENLNSFLEEELNRRKKYHFPPFSKLTKIEFKEKDLNKLKTKTKNLERKLNQNRVKFHSVTPLIYRKNNLFIHHIFLQNTNPLKYIQELILDPNCIIDRDPQSTL
ncbi:primosomal protein N' [bacterium]|jgi:primosomal protein N' (replication factor Y) (superfamily II helicase)|nr:primosomal protein N' [bacterium]MBT6293251.1 primosomal protein N' [bacterium]